MPRVGSSISTTRRLGGQPAGEHDLLLVAAGEELRPPGPSTRAETSSEESTPGTSRRAARGAAREDRADHAEGVVEDRLVEGQAGGLAVLGDHREAGRGSPGAASADRERRAVEEHRAAGERADAEDRLEQLGAAGALQPGDADDLAGAQGRGRCRRRTRCRRRASSSRGSPTSVPVDRVGEERRDRAADHQPHELGVVELGGRPGGDLLAVLEHGDGVAEVEDLLEPVGDVEDRDAALGEAAR